MRLPVYAIGVAGLTLVTALLGRELYSRREAVWAAKLAEKTEVAKHAELQAREAEKGITVAKRELERRDARIRALEARRIPVREIRDTLVQALPDTCRAAVEPLLTQLEIRDSLLELKDSNLVAYDRVTVFLGQQVVAARLVAQKWEHEAKRPARRWYVPRVGVGLAAGADITGKPNVVAGLTLGWSF